MRLYKLGSPIADIFDAVQNPSQIHDDELREAVGREDIEVIRKIRDLVCP